MFVVGGAIIIVRDRDLDLLWPLLVGIVVSLFMASFWSAARDLWHRRKHITDCFIAFTDDAFVYQDYDFERVLARKVIPLTSIHGFEYVCIPSHDPDVPDSHEIHVHFTGAGGKHEVLKLGYFDYKLSSPCDTLNDELAQLKSKR